MLKIGHGSNQLRSKINGDYSELIKNNIVVPQESPLIAYLFIIYVDHIMNEYNK